jgi:hypothetical protein
VSFPKIPSRLDSHRKAESSAPLIAMFAILHALGMFVVDLFKSRSRLEAENLFLRHQLNIALRRAPPRLRLHGSDRALLVWITRFWPNLLDLSQVVKPVRWHRSGFKAFWRWKSRHRAGRPKIDRELRDLIQRMSRENPLARTVLNLDDLNDPLVETIAKKIISLASQGIADPDEIRRRVVADTEGR